MGILTVQLLNSLLYAATLFLIAGGLSLIYGVMRVVNLAHGTLYALGAFVMAWMAGALATSVPPVALLTLGCSPPRAAPPATVHGAPLCFTVDTTGSWDRSPARPARRR